MLWESLFGLYIFVILDYGWEFGNSLIWIRGRNCGGKVVYGYVIRFIFGYFFYINLGRFVYEYVL